MTRGREIEIPLASKSPFANYDLVVYLGGGLFALFIAWRYVVDPFDIFDLTSLASTTSEDSWTKQIVFLLLLSILSYTVGHLAAYLSSHFIEGFLNRTIGSFSDLVILSSKDRPAFEADLVTNVIKNKSASFSWNRGSLIWAAHAPYGLFYWAIFQFKLFDALDTRIPARMLQDLAAKIALFFNGVSTNDKRQWFRWIEYYTNYNAPIASASMYNYLIISGFMRSISFLLLLASWCELVHLFYYFATGIPKIHVEQGWGSWVAYAMAISTGFICSLTAYAKFYRRYVEEAILGFMLEIGPEPKSG